MSALADGRARAGSRPPNYTSLVVATMAAQVTTGLALWTVQLPFALLGIGPTSIAANIWLPWSIDGVWSALGLAAYVLIVCMLGGAMIGQRVAYRAIARPAPAWAWLAFGASGYVAMALGHSGGARLLLAIVLAPLTVRLFGYRVDGTVRPWPSRVSVGRRGIAPLLLLAAALVLSYSAAHAFAQNGTAGSPASVLAPGHMTVINVGLHGIVLPAQATSVVLDGVDADHLGVVRAAVASEGGGPLASAGRSGVTGPVAHALPVRLPARSGTWLAVGVRLLSCPARSARIDAITLHYRVLGIATSERIQLWNPIRLACPPAAAAGS